MSEAPHQPPAAFTEAETARLLAECSLLEAAVNLLADALHATRPETAAIRSAREGLTPSDA